MFSLVTKPHFINLFASGSVPLPTRAFFSDSPPYPFGPVKTFFFERSTDVRGNLSERGVGEEKPRLEELVRPAAGVGALCLSAAYRRPPTCFVLFRFVLRRLIGVL